jgi:hypothetical protein
VIKKGNNEEKWHSLSQKIRKKYLGQVPTEVQVRRIFFFFGALKEKNDEIADYSGFVCLEKHDGLSKLHADSRESR